MLLVRNQSDEYKSVISIAGFVQESEYHLYKRVQFEPDYSNVADSSAGRTYSLLRMKMRVRRESGYWVWNVM